jgi:branched-subunit amino acid transport protein
MLLGRLITFRMRFSLIYLLAEGRFEVPETIQKALYYVPPAVVAATILASSG